MGYAYLHLDANSVVGSSGANLFFFNLLLQLEATAGRGTVGLQEFSLRDYKTLHNITVRRREKRHVCNLIDTFPTIKFLLNTRVKLQYKGNI